MSTSAPDNMGRFLYPEQEALKTYSPGMLTINLFAFHFISLSPKTDVLPIWHLEIRIVHTQEMQV